MEIIAVKDYYIPIRADNGTSTGGVWVILFR